MILDTINNYQTYEHLDTKIAKALEFLKNSNFSEIADGKYELDAENVYYTVQRYQTQPFAAGKLEKHRNYIDIQYIAKGQEAIGHSNADALKILEPYSSETDCEFYQQPQNLTKLNLTQNSFAIFWPHDAHMPCRDLEKQAEVLKIVIKIKAI